MSRNSMKFESLPLPHVQTDPAPEVQFLGPDSPSTGADPQIQGRELIPDIEQQWDRITKMLELLMQIHPDVSLAAVKEANRFSRQAVTSFTSHDFPHRLHLKELPELTVPHVQCSMATAPSQAAAQPPTAKLASHQCRTSSPDIEARLTEEVGQVKTEKLYDEIAAMIPDTLRSSEGLKDVPRLISLMKEAVRLPTPIDINVLCLSGDEMEAQRYKLTTRLEKLQKLQEWAKRTEKKQPGSSSIKTLRKILPILHSRFKLEEYSKRLPDNSLEFLLDQERGPEDIARYLAVDGSNIWLQSLLQHVQSSGPLSTESIQRAYNKMTAVQQVLDRTILDTMWDPPEESEGQPSDQGAEAETPGDEPENTQRLDSKGKGASTPRSGQRDVHGEGGQQRDDEVAEHVLDVTSPSDTLDRRQEAPDLQPRPRGLFEQSKKHPYTLEELADSQ